MDKTCTPCRLGVALNEAFDEIQGSIDARDAVTGLATGFALLDHLTAGLHKGDLVIVAGRPSMGKTTFVSGIVDGVGVSGKRPVLYFTLEESRADVARRLACARARVELHRVRSGDCADEEIERLTKSADDLADAPVFIEDSPRLTVEQACATTLALRENTPLALVVVDYLQAVEAAAGTTRHEQISHVARRLKALARELDLPVVVTSHLSRRVDSRESRVPRLEDLSESGALEQDADVILFLCRESQYSPTPENRGTAEVIVAKQRDGPTGCIPLRFLDHIRRFEDAGATG